LTLKNTAFAVFSALTLRFYGKKIGKVFLGSKCIEVQGKAGKGAQKGEQRGEQSQKDVQ
jgi:hypothetical protein